MENRSFRIAVLSTILIIGLAGCMRKSPDNIEWEVDQGAQTIGNFTVMIKGDNSAGRSLKITHRSEPDRVLWESISGAPFITAGKGQADIREHGQPEGSFDIRDQTLKRCDHQTVTEVKRQGDSLMIGGSLSGRGCETGYRLTLEEAGDNQLRFQIRLGAPGPDDLNRISLRYASTKDEHFFGFGQQLT